MTAPALLALALIALFVVVLWIRQRRRWALNPGDPGRPPLCPKCVQRMGWSLTCRHCGASWPSPAALHWAHEARVRRVMREGEPRRSSR